MTFPVEVYKEAERSHLGAPLRCYRSSARKTVRSLLLLILMACVACSALMADALLAKMPTTEWLNLGRTFLLVVSVLGGWSAALGIFACAGELVTFFLKRHECLYECQEGFFVIQASQQITTIIHWSQIEEITAERRFPATRGRAYWLRCRDGQTVSVGRKFWERTRDRFIQQHAHHCQFTIVSSISIRDADT
jgi:hypothetical protein